jgi:HlyD family secretion protein
MNARKSLLTPLLIFAAVAAAAGGYRWWHQTHRDTGAQRYKTEALGRGDVVQSVSANGTLNPVVLVNVGTQVSGTVKKLYADFNARVERGQILMELDDSLFRAQARQSEANVASAESAVKLAEANADRARDLFAQEYVSRQELDQAQQALAAAQAQLAQARAQLDKDRTNLGYTVIRSPVSGVVVDRQIDVGQTVAASFQTPTLFKIAEDLRNMQIDSSFAEADVGNIRQGQPAHFTVDAFPDRAFSGTVRQVRLNPTTQSNVVTYDVVVALENPDKILLPGMTAYVTIVTAEHQDVLRVPNAALRFRPEEGRGVKERGGRGSHVYTLENGQLHAVPVTTVLSDNRYTEVRSPALKPGDQVVVEDARQAAADGRSSSRFRMRLF